MLEVSLHLASLNFSFFIHEFIQEFYIGAKSLYTNMSFKIINNTGLQLLLQKVKKMDVFAA